MYKTSASLLVLLCFAPLGGLLADDTDKKQYPLGHSLHGEAFDEGPRQQAWRMQGMGDISFPVSTANPDAQLFFNQGVAQLHTFYYFEAERSFRQALLLDPQCAMAYWGMAMANQNNRKRAQAFIAKAQAEAAKLTERERKYIEALAVSLDDGRKDPERTGDYIRGLESIVLDYPDDIEAKAFLAWTLVGASWGGKEISSHVAVNELVEDVLRHSPRHPGAHHYRIHLWDNHDAKRALLSAQAYAEAAPAIAHAWHMPGHIYNRLSRWREASYQQEGSARIDHAHMLEHAIMPFEIHNYAHNTHYLVANLSHMGRARDAIDFSRSLIETPRDPQRNDKQNRGGAQRLGRACLLRVYVRYERWDDILNDPHLDWSDAPEEQAWKSYSLGLAYLGKSDRARAGEQASRLDSLAKEAAKNPGFEADLMETARLELRGRLAVAEGRQLEGFELLEKGAKLQAEKFQNDLAGYPRPFREAVGLAHLEARNWGLAEANFRAVLADRQNALVSLAGLTEACLRGGKEVEAAEAYQLFLVAWRDADQDLAYGNRLKLLAAALPAVSSAPADAKGEGAAMSSLEPLGPKLWSPSPAPDFALEDAAGARVKLADFRGKNVVLVFYLGSACEACMAQLKAIAKEKSAFDGLNAQLLAVSQDTPEKSRELLKSPSGAELTIPLLSDPGWQVSKLYKAYDTFESFPLHGVILVDREQKIRWSRTSAQPFTETAFLKAEIERVNKLLEAGRAPRGTLATLKAERTF